MTNSRRARRAAETESAAGPPPWRSGAGPGGGPVVWVLVFLVASLAAVYFNRTLVRSTLPQQTNSTTSSRKIRHVCRDRTIFITDASSGYAREAALLLSQQGFHVLAGVKTESQRRSFVYDVASRKGLEPVVVDISDPAQLADLLYRIRQVALDLQRPLYGVLINSLQEIEYLETGLPTDGRGPQSSGGKGRGSSNKKKKVAAPEPAAVLRASSLDVDSLETAYRRLLKGPARLIQAALQPDMWGGTGLGLALGEEEEKEREECEGLTGRVVLLSPTLSSDIPPAASAQISALHNWLLAGSDSGSGSGSEAETGAGAEGRGVTVVQVLEQSSAEQRRRRFAGGGLSWALDLSASGMAGPEPGRCSASSSSIAGDGVGVGECGQATLKPLDSSFSPRANLLARALVSQRPQRVYFL